jgi:hypothetical protein
LSIQASLRLSHIQNKTHNANFNREWGYTFLADDAGCFVFIVSYIQTNAMPNSNSSL